MTPDELRDARRRLGLSQSQLGERLRLGKNGGRTVRMWEAEDNVRGVPGPVQVAVEYMLREAEGGDPAANIAAWLRSQKYPVNIRLAQQFADAIERGDYRQPDAASAQGSKVHAEPRGGR